MNVPDDMIARIRAKALWMRRRAFGWQVETVDGHDPAALLALLTASPKGRGKPLCVIANTTKGKGVSFVENKANWHHGVPNAEQFAAAMKEPVQWLKSLQPKVNSTAVTPGVKALCVLAEADPRIVAVANG